MRTELSTAHPRERRLILVASDEKYQSLTSAVDWKKIVAASGAALGMSTLLSPVLAIPAALIIATPNLKKRLKRVSLRQELPMPHLRPDEAERLFRFDVGHPVDGTAYALNPYLTDYYLLPAVVNERLAQEKLAAFVEISANLGAKQIEILSANMIGNKVGANIGLADIAAQIGLNVSVSKNSSISRQVFMTFGKPVKAPVVPDALRFWLDTDPVLRTLATTRLNHNALTSETTLQFGESIEVNGKVCSTLAELGIDVGGEYRSVQGSAWHFSIQFWPH